MVKIFQSVFHKALSRTTVVNVINKFDMLHCSAVVQQKNSHSLRYLAAK